MRKRKQRCGDCEHWTRYKYPRWIIAFLLLQNMIGECRILSDKVGVYTDSKGTAEYYECKSYWRKWWKFWRSK